MDLPYSSYIAPCDYVFRAMTQGVSEQHFNFFKMSKMDEFLERIERCGISSLTKPLFARKMGESCS